MLLDGNLPIHALLDQRRGCRLATRPRLAYAVPILAKASHDIPRSIRHSTLNVSLTKVCWFANNLFHNLHCTEEGRSPLESRMGQHRTRSPLGNAHFNQPNGSSSRAILPNNGQLGCGLRNVRGKSSLNVPGHASSDYCLSGAAKIGKQVSGKSYWSNPNIGA